MQRTAGNRLSRATAKYVAGKSRRDMERLTVRRGTVHDRRRKGRRLRASNRFQEWEIALLGTAPDPVIARQIGRAPSSVACKRRKLGIAAFTQHLPWTSRDDSLLGKMSDADAARRMGRKRGTVRFRRRSLGIPYFGGKRRYWKK